MTSKARHLRNDRPHTTISVDALFTAAFRKSQFAYQRESLLGWRPIEIEVEPEPIMPPSSEATGPQFSNSPDVKVQENADHIVIEVDLPNIDEESLFLEVSGDLLIIKAQKEGAGQNPSDEDKPAMVRRYVKLPITVQPGNIRARMDNGILSIMIGKPMGGGI